MWSPRITRISTNESNYFLEIIIWNWEFGICTLGFGIYFLVALLFRIPINSAFLCHSESRHRRVKNLILGHYVRDS